MASRKTSVPRDGMGAMTNMRIGYARACTDEQDLEVQSRAVALGVSPERIYVDHGFTGRNVAGGVGRSKKP